MRRKIMSFIMWALCVPARQAMLHDRTRAVWAGGGRQGCRSKVAGLMVAVLTCGLAVAVPLRAGESHEVMTAAVRQEEGSIRVVHQFAELN